MEEKKKKSNVVEEKFNPLRNEVVNVEFIKKSYGMVTDPKSPLYGGLSEVSTITLCAPNTANGGIAPVLTVDEQKFFEELFNMSEGTLNPNRVKDNYWSTFEHGFNNRVIIGKLGIKLHLNDPIDYIKYKILLANDNIVCPSQEELENHRKNSYRFVINNEKQVATSVGNKADLKWEVYEQYGKYKEDPNILRAIIYLVEHKKVSPSTKLEMLKAKVMSLMDDMTKEVHAVMMSKTLDQKALLLTATEKGFVGERNGIYYLKETGKPLCEEYEEATLNNAANYLADPANQELMFNLQKKCS